MSSHVPVWFRQLPYSTLKDILLEYVTRSILVSCASRAARSLSSIDVPTIMPATGASPARFFLTQPIYLDNCPKTLSAARPFFNSIRSEEHTSELQSLMRISYAVFCLKKKIKNTLNIPECSNTAKQTN